MDLVDLIQVRDAEIGRAVDHANREIPRWSDLAYVALQAFLRIHAGTFIAPAVRQWAETRGVPVPPSNRAWGGVIRRARRAGLIVRDGYCDYGDGSMHLQTVTVWRRA